MTVIDKDIMQSLPWTFVGRGHSSRSSVTTDGPSGSSDGITLITVSITLIHPVSSSASLCSCINDHGGCWSLHKTQELQQ